MFNSDLQERFARGSYSLDAAVQTLDITKRFGDLTAVKSINLTIDCREIFGLIGPNGAGKTTLIRMLTTIIPPTEGTAKISGFDIRVVMYKGAGLQAVIGDFAFLASFTGIMIALATAAFRRAL